EFLSIGECTVGFDVVHHPKFVEPAVGDVKFLLVRRERQPIGIGHFLGQKLELAGRGHAVHTVETQLGLEVVVGIGRIPASDRIWIGEVDISVALAHHVVRAIETLALVALREGGHGSILLGTRYAPVPMLTRDEAALPVQGKSICTDLHTLWKFTAENRFTKSRELSRGSPLHNRVGRNITEQQVSSIAQPDWALRELKIAGYLLD